MTNTMTALGAEVRAEMSRQALTLDDLANALGVHTSTASRIRQGKASLDADQLGALSRFLGIGQASDLLARVERSLAGTAAA